MVFNSKSLQLLVIVVVYTMRASISSVKCCACACQVEYTLRFKENDGTRRDAGKVMLRSRTFRCPGVYLPFINILHLVGAKVCLCTIFLLGACNMIRESRG